MSSKPLILRRDAALESRWALQEYGTDAALVEAAARDLAERVNRGGLGTLALSGGRIASAFFDAAAALGRPQGAPWRGIHFFWADERCVPPTHEQSNYLEARRRLLDPLDIPAGQVHRLRGEADPTTAAAEAEANLLEVAPRLDLVLLGMGEDGHVASLFPGLPPATAASRSLYVAVTGPKPPAHRITLSYRALAEAEEVWVLVAGPGKEQALRMALDGGCQLPLGRLLASRIRGRLMVSHSICG